MKDCFRVAKGKSGFTIIELLVALVILGALASIAIPAFSVWLPRYRLKGAARDVFSNMQLAKLEAIKQNANCSVTMDTGNNQYTVQCLPKTVLLSEYGDGVTFQGPDAGDSTTATITFSSRGLCNIGTVYLTNSKNSAYYKVQTSTSGGISLKKYNGIDWE